MRLEEGRWLCGWCGADLGLPFLDRETVWLVPTRDGTGQRSIVVRGEERHRCARPDLTLVATEARSTAVDDELALR